MVRSVVAPFDGSSLAARALPVAAGIAARTGAVLHVVSVYVPPIPVRGEQGAMVSDQRLDQEAMQLLQQDLVDITSPLAQAHPQLRIETVALRGAPASQIASYVEQITADLVVMCSHGHGGFTRMWLGSIAEGLIRRLQVPLLVLPADDNVPKVADEFRRVLVPLDCSTPAERAIDSAQAIAAPDATYVLLTVASPLHPLLQRLSSEEEYDADQQSQRAIASHYLHHAVERVPIGRDRVEPMVKLDIQPARTIVATGNEVNADLIAMTTRAAGPLGRFFLGSVADKVVRTSTLPVLLQHVE